MEEWIMSHELTHLVLSVSRAIADHPTIVVLESGQVSRTGWRKFAIERYLIGRYFETMLEATEGMAQAEGHTDIAATLHRNLCDERGVDEAGQLHPDRAHETWRVDFYNALGLTALTLSSATVSSAARTYVEDLKRYADEGDAFFLGGLILSTEHHLPFEFDRLLRGVERTFPEQFVLNTTDSANVRRKKELARRYLVDHIAHDARYHYPDLYRALIPCLDDWRSRKQIRLGVRRMGQMKRAFYTSVGKLLESG